MKNSTFQIILRPKITNSKGKKPIYLRFTYNRTPHLLSLNLAVDENRWDPVARRIRGNSKEINKANTLLSKYKAKAETIIYNYRVAGKVLTFDQFKAEFKSEEMTGSFIDFAKKEIELLRPSFAPGTIKTYLDQVSKLQEFRKEVLFGEIDPSFLQAYENFLLGTRNNNKNTVAKSLSFIRSMFNKAIEKGIVKENPFTRYKVGRIEGDREFLTLEELEKLDALFWAGTLDKFRNNVLHYFLFACYTGLRYSDLASLRFKDIQERKKIQLTMHKTKKKVLIPLTNKAIRLLPEDEGFENQKVFKVLTNQPSNRYLKDIMTVAKINKTLTMHCARHTFGTCALDLGISLEVISEIMGHMDTKTTRIYSRLREGRKNQEMEKWNGI